MPACTADGKIRHPLARSADRCCAGSRADAALPPRQARSPESIQGYPEVVNFAFVEIPGSWISPITAHRSGWLNRLPGQMAVLRSALIPVGLVANLATNLRRKRRIVSGCFRERPVCFLRDALGRDQLPGFHQPWRLGESTHGAALPEGWGCGWPAKSTSFDLKADLEALLSPGRSL